MAIAFFILITSVAQILILVGISRSLFSPEKANERTLSLIAKLEEMENTLTFLMTEIQTETDRIMADMDAKITRSKKVMMACRPESNRVVSRTILADSPVSEIEIVVNDPSDCVTDDVPLPPVATDFEVAKTQSIAESEAALYRVFAQILTVLVWVFPLACALSRPM